jgi:hypothetical protein
MTISVAITTALKEWAVAVEALAQGETILLLRKGGIREQGGSFTVEQSRFCLYPTFEHQKPHLLKPDYADQVVPVASGWHPETVTISAWAEMTHTFQVHELDTVLNLLPFQIWTADFLTERLKWKPRTPLTVLLLRVYRMAQPHTVIYDPAYGGCKSWIELPESLASAPAIPALTEAVYLQQVQAVSQTISHHLSQPSSHST